VKNILSFIWQVPQNIIGLFIMLVNYKSVTMDKSKKYFRVKHLCDCGISLGNYIIIDLDADYEDWVIGHEQGHQKQSQMFGWLYLVLFGLPSICGNIIDRIFHKNWKVSKRLDWYYNLPWEKYANKLGGVHEICMQQVKELQKYNY
jgi:hypothetical protein